MHVFITLLLEGIVKGVSFLVSCVDWGFSSLTNRPLLTWTQVCGQVCEVQNMAFSPSTPPPLCLCARQADWGVNAAETLSGSPGRRAAGQSSRPLILSEEERTRSRGIFTKSPVDLWAANPAENTHECFVWHETSK